MTLYQENRVYMAQQRWIRTNCGRQAAANANYGWSQEEDTICTKIYGHGVLTSWLEGGRVQHSFEAF